MIGDDRLGVGGEPLELLAGGRLGLGPLLGRAVGGPDRDLATLGRHRHELEAAGGLLVDLDRQLLVDVAALGIGHRQSDRPAECGGVLDASDAVLGEQDLAELPEVAVTVSQRRREGVAGQVPGLDQCLTECDALLDTLADLVDRPTGASKPSPAFLSVLPLRSAIVRLAPSHFRSLHAVGKTGGSDGSIGHSIGMF